MPQAPKVAEGYMLEVAEVAEVEAIYIDIYGALIMSIPDAV